jgi:hypothetical protein
MPQLRGFVEHPTAVRRFLLLIRDIRFTEESKTSAMTVWSCRLVTTLPLGILATAQRGVARLGLPGGFCSLILTKRRVPVIFALPRIGGRRAYWHAACESVSCDNRTDAKARKILAASCR